MMKAVILAAGLGSRIRPLTNNCPKCLLCIDGTSILERMLSHIQFCGINEVVFILGYYQEQIKEVVESKFPKLKAHFVINANYTKTNTGFSLMLAKDFIKNSGFIKFDADVIFERAILEKLIKCSDANCLCIDKKIQLDAEEIKVILNFQNQVLEASKEVEPRLAAGESIGIEKIDRSTAKRLFSELEAMMKDEKNHQAYYEAAYNKLIKKGDTFYAIDISELKWMEIDTKDDFIKAEKIFKK